MASFAERFGVEIPGQDDPEGRRQVVEALRARDQRRLKQLSGFRPSPNGQWEIIPEGLPVNWDDPPADPGVDWEAETRIDMPTPRARPQQLPAGVAAARNQVMPDNSQPKAEPAWLIEGREEERLARAKADPIGPKRPQISQGEAVGRGLQQGGSFGWIDEIKGLGDASGLPKAPLVAMPGVNTVLDLGRAAVGGVRMLAGNKDATEAYDRTVGNERFRGETARQQHPVTSTVAEIAGGAAVPLPGGVGTTIARTALRQGGIGAAGGAIQALGESKDKSAKDALIGGGVGGVLGTTLPLAGRLLGMGISKPVNFLRNAWDPQGGAERAVGAAMRDSEAVAARARAQGRQGEPVATRAQAVDPGSDAVLADTLGTSGETLIRSASNVSPRANAELTEQLGERSRQRTARSDQFINQEANYPNPLAQQEAISEAAARANDPNYRRVMVLGDYDLAAGNTGAQGLTALAERSPAVRRATQDAEGALQDLYAGRGERWDGVRNLEFWDQVKRQLDQEVNRAETRGLNTDAMRLGRVRDAIVQRLDMQVPEYQTTRSVAQSFFGQRDALAAGQAFFGDKRNHAASLQAFRQMGDTEKQLFRDGLMDRVRQTARTDQNFWNKYDRNVGGLRDKLQGVLPPDQLNRLEAFGTLERAMQTTANYVRGNSTTARQLQNMGLATAAGAGLGYDQGDFNTTGQLGAASLALLAKRGVDQRVATRIAEVLMTKDPAVIQRASQAFSRDPQYMQALRILRNSLSQSTQREVAAAPSRGEQR